MDWSRACFPLLIVDPGIARLGAAFALIVRGVVETHTDGRPLKGFLGVYARNAPVVNAFQ